MTHWPPCSDSKHYSECYRQERPKEHSIQNQQNHNLEIQFDFEENLLGSVLLDQSLIRICLNGLPFYLSLFKKNSIVTGSVLLRM